MDMLVTARAMLDRTLIKCQQANTQLNQEKHNNAKKEKEIGALTDMLHHARKL
jgi:hypothetical protein